MSEETKGGFAPGVQIVDLVNFRGGVIPELFEQEWARVLEDCDNPNTPEKAKRKILIEITVEPVENREKLICSVQVKSKLAGIRPFGAGLQLTKHKGRLVAVQGALDQGNLFAGDERPRLVKGEGE
jgi:hypothetical protein